MLVVTHAKEYITRLGYIVSLFVGLFSISFYYKEEFLYLALNPFLQAIGANSLLVTKLQELLQIEIVLCLFLSSLISVCVLFLTTLHYMLPGLHSFELNRLFYRFVIVLGTILVVLFFCYLGFGPFLKYWLMVGYPEYTEFIHYRVDITLHNYISILLWAVLGIIVVMLSSSVIINCSFKVEKNSLYIARLAFYTLVCLVIIFCLPPDPTLHVLFFLSFSLFFELLIVLVIFGLSYSNN